jgi:hypothetical protein
MSNDSPIDPEDLVITAYCALDDAFKHAGVVNNKGYWPKQDKRLELVERGITIIACAHGNQKYCHTPSDTALLKKRRPHVERLIGLFDRRFNATRTQCRNFRN